MNLTDFLTTSTTISYYDETTNFTSESYNLNTDDYPTNETLIGK